MTLQQMRGRETTLPTRNPSRLWPLTNVSVLRNRTRLIVYMLSELQLHVHVLLLTLIQIECIDTRIKNLSSIGMFNLHLI